MHVLCNNRYRDKAVVNARQMGMLLRPPDVSKGAIS